MTSQMPRTALRIIGAATSVAAGAAAGTAAATVISRNKQPQPLPVAAKGNLSISAGQDTECSVDAKPVIKLPAVKPVNADDIEKKYAALQNKNNADCAPEIREASHLDWPFKNFTIPFQRREITLPFVKASGEKEYAENLPDFVKKASDKDILAVWDAIEKALPESDVLDQQGAHVYLKVKDGKVCADVRVAEEVNKHDGRLKTKTGDFMPSNKSPLYVKSQIGEKNFAGEEKHWITEKDGFVQFQALGGKDLHVREEDLVCPQIARGETPPEYYEDLSTFLRYTPKDDADKKRWEDKKVTYFKRFTEALEPLEKGEDREEIMFHVGRLRSQPYIHAHIIHPDRSYLDEIEADKKL